MRNEASVVVALSAENKGAFEMFDRLRKEQEKAKQGMESFNQQAQRTKAGMGQFGELLGQGSKLLGSFGLALGAGKIAMDTFKGAIASTQATADAWEKATAGLKATWDEFLQSIATADFSNLINNMANAYEQGQRLAEIMDDLGDKQWAYGMIKGDEDLRAMELEDIIRNSKDPQAKKKAMAEYKALSSKQVDDANYLAETYDKAVDAKIINAIGGDLKPDSASIKKIRDIYTKTQWKRDAKLMREYEKYQKAEEAIKKVPINRGSYKGMGVGTGAALTGLINDLAGIKDERMERKREKEKAKKWLEDFKKRDPEKYYAFKGVNAITDPERDELKELYRGKNTMQMSAYQMRIKLRRFNSLANGTSTGATTAKVAKVDKEAEKRALNEQIAQQQAKALPLFDYERVKIKIDELTDYIKKQEDKLKVTVKGSVEFDQIQKDIETKKTELGNITKANAPAPLDMDKISQKAKEIDTATFKAPEGVEDFTSGMQTMENSINSVSNAFGAFTSLVDGSSDSFLGWLGNATRAVTSVLPLIEMLTAKQKVSAVVNTADAAAKGASSVAGIPFVGPALAVAAVATIVATLAKTQKFATGGIVGGHSYYGDKILARVNSGELILNNRQQKTIYEGLSPHIDRTQNINVGGAFKIQGKDLVLSYNRTTKQLNRN